MIMYSLCCHAYRDALSPGAECAAIPNRYGGIVLISPQTQPFCCATKELGGTWGGRGYDGALLDHVCLCVQALATSGVASTLRSPTTTPAWK